MKLLPILAALILGVGCRGTASPADAAPGEIHLVAILPFFDETGSAAYDGDEFGSILASELVKVSGVRALRPSQLRAALGPGNKFETVGDAIQIARKLGADTVLACAITDYDPYDPPRIGVHAQLLRSEPRTLSTKDLDVLLQSASWRKGPLTLSRDGARHALAAFEEIYDARDAGTRRLIQAYARKVSLRESELTAVQPRFLQFVSNQIITRAWELSRPHGS